nr:unnamed protein product [Callosobruchus chinensis]
MEEHFFHNIIIPPSPNWYEPSVMTYTPNDMLIYGFKGDLIIISNMANKAQKELVAVKIMRRVHSQRITSVAVNSKFGEDGSLLVTTAEDKYVKLWDMERFEIKAAHHQHVKSNRIVSAAFAGSHKVVSVSDDGHIIVWSFNNNEMLHMTNMFNAKVTLTSMSICPHYPRLVAFGMKSGLIVVLNLEGTGQVVCHLRGHDKEVISMDWCPIPFNIFPKNPNNEVYITPEQFRAAGREDTRAAGREDTAAFVQELIDEILDSVSILAQQALDMAGSKQSTIKDTAAAQTAPQTSTEMTPGANVDEKNRLDKAIPKLQDLVPLSFTKPYCEKCSKEECACVNVGLFNLEKKTGIPEVMPHCFTKEIFKMQWAPAYDDVYGLYIVAEGRLVFWDVETPEAALSAMRSRISGAKEEENKKCRNGTLKRDGGSEDKCQREKQKKPTELLPVYHRSRTSAVEFVADLRRLFTYVTDGVLERDANSEVDLLDIFGYCGVRLLRYMPMLLVKIPILMRLKQQHTT